MNRLTPIAGVCRNPLLGLRPPDMIQVGVGVRLREIAPEAQGLLVCRYNGEWLLREHWDEHTRPGDVIEWYDVPQGNGLRQAFLIVVAIVATIYTENPQVGLAIYSLGNTALSLIAPIRQQDPDFGAAASGVFSTALSGNAARVDQPIWKNCGRVKITPPFAAQPYFEFLPSDLESPTVDCDQYYYAIFAVGLGDHTLEKAFIGKTPISHFQDVTIAQYLAPGVRPSQALANVVTSAEVTQLELDSDEDGVGVYVGGYAACRPQDTVVDIGIDITASQGLGKTGTTGTSPITVEWQVEVREINDFGAPVGDWQIVAAESRTANTNTSQRWSNKYTLSTPIRCEVRTLRTNAKSSDSNTRDSIQWFGLRAYLERPAPLNAETAHYEVVMRASQQLSGLSQRDFSMIVRGWCPTWNPLTGWSASGETRNAAWWLADLWRSEIWGEGLPDDRIDLQGLYDWSLTLDARQDHFDFAFTSSRDAWAAAQTIAQTGRARASAPYGLRTIARDELVDLPTTAFSVRNTQPSSMSIQAALPSREQPDGVIVQYQSNVTWDVATVTCPCPGVVGTDMMNPVYVTIEGIVGAFHAEREGLYMAAKMALRGNRVTCTTEMEGVTVRFLDTVRWQPEIKGYGQSGDVAFWDQSTFVMGLTEPPDFTLPQYLTLIRDDGTLTDPVLVSVGPTAYDITLPELPDFEIVVNDGTRERPKYLLGSIDTGDELVKIDSKTDGGKTDGGAQLYDLVGYIDDERVHAADNALLPGPGDIQDPVDDGLDFDTGGGRALLHLTNHELVGTTSVGDCTVGFRMATNGAAQGEVTEGGSPAAGSPFVYVHQWTSGEIEPTVAALYEVRCTVAFSSNGTGLDGASDAAGTWWNLGTERLFEVALAVGASIGFNQWNLTIEIRRVGTTIVQQRRTIAILITDPA